MSDKYNIQAHIDAVQDEISRQSPDKTITITRDNKILKAASALLAAFIIVEGLINRPHDADPESDVDHILQQARHEVLDYQHRYGRLPDQLVNPALRPFVTYQPDNNGRYTLIAKVGDSIQEYDG